MLWSLENLSRTVFDLDLRAHFDPGRHFRNRLPGCSNGAPLGLVWPTQSYWQRFWFSSFHHVPRFRHHLCFLLFEGDATQRLLTSARLLGLANSLVRLRGS